MVKIAGAALPVHLMGYRANLLATGIHDDLHVAVLYLDSGDERVALLTYDTIANSQQFCDAVQSACSEATGLDPRQILLTVSHSHSTPLAVRARSRGAAGVSTTGAYCSAGSPLRGSSTLRPTPSSS